MKELPVDRLNELVDKVPAGMVIDIENRMGDWMLSEEHHLDDPYMWKQVKFAENWIKYHGGKS